MLRHNVPKRNSKFKEVNFLIGLRTVIHKYRVVRNLPKFDLPVRALEKVIWSNFFFAKLHSAVSGASDSRARGVGLDIRSGHLLSFLLSLVQEGQLSVTGERMCTKYWLTA